MTESNKIQQNSAEPKLTGRQLKVIPIIVASATYSEGCKKARLNRTTFYEWLKKPEFKAELNRQRDEIAAEAFGVLSQGLTKAVETLVSLLDNKDNRLKRLAAKDIVDFVLRHKENAELDCRLTELERILAEKGK
jgi:hypothetical protein